MIELDVDGICLAHESLDKDGRGALGKFLEKEYVSRDIPFTSGLYGLHVMFGTIAASLGLCRCLTKQGKPISVAVLCNHE